MTDFLDQYAAQFRAAAAAECTRARRASLIPVAVGALAAAAVAAAVVVTRPQTLERELDAAPPVTRAGGGYAEQRALLGVLRNPTAQDRHPQVRRTVRDFRDEKARTGRLLGLAPGGGAYVLVATRRYPETVHGRRSVVPPRAEVRWRRDGLCLMRRGTQGGAGHCGGTGDLLAGRLRGALAGQVYGVVPDGVTHVRAPNRDDIVPVLRNFYVYPAHGNPGPPPVWLDADGNEVPPQLARLDRPARSSLADLRGHVTVVGFWASWCKPCGQQLETLQRLYERGSAGGAAVVGIANSDQAADARAVMRERGVGFAVLDDPDAMIAHQNDVRAFPQTLVLAADGSVAASFRGPVSLARLEQAVRDAG